MTPSAFLALRRRASTAGSTSRMASLRRDFLPATRSGEMARRGRRRSDRGAGAADARRDALAAASSPTTHPFIAGVVGWVDLQAADVDAQLDACRGHPKLVGVRHIVQGEPRRVPDAPGVPPRASAGWSSFGLDVRHPRVCAAAAGGGRASPRAFPRQRFVLDHLGQAGHPRRRDCATGGGDLDALAALPNVCCKLSGLVTEADWACVDAGAAASVSRRGAGSFGPARLMIGSDWPVCTGRRRHTATSSAWCEMRLAEYSVTTNENRCSAAPRAV